MLNARFTGLLPYGFQWLLCINEISPLSAFLHHALLHLHQIQTHEPQYICSRALETASTQKELQWFLLLASDIFFAKHVLTQQNSK
jgi:hypothetical protein